MQRSTSGPGNGKLLDSRHLAATAKGLMSSRYGRVREGDEE